MNNGIWIKPPRQWQINAFEAVKNHFQTQSDSGIVSAVMGSGKSILIAAIASGMPLEKDEVIVISTTTEHLVEDFYGEMRKAVSGTGVWYGRMKRMGKIIVTCVPSVSTLSARLKALNQRVKLWIADEAHKTECDSILGCYEALSPKYSIGFTATAFRSIHKETISLFDKIIYKYSIGNALADGCIVPWKIENWLQEQPDDLNIMYLAMIKNAQGPGLINANDIADAEQFAKYLNEQGIKAAAIHSKLKKYRQKAILSDLKEGRLSAIVHVNLLAEGANFPFLRWSLLRRQVEARVRFIQEIGRLLRSFPGKTEAIFYDPHDLFGNFALTYAEALGEIEETKPIKEEMRTPEEIERVIKDTDDPMIIMTNLESSIRALTVACDLMTNYPRKILPKNERVKPSNGLQSISVKSNLNILNGFIPDQWRNILNLVYDNSSKIRFGFMADLLWVLSAVKQLNKWPNIGQDGRIGVMA